MKKLISTTVMMFFLSISFNAKAEKGIELKIEGGQILVVEFGNMEKGTFLLFQDEQGEVLYKDNLITDKPYRASLDLGNLPKGTYHLNVEREFAILNSVITKSEEGLKITKNSEIVLKPRFKVEDDKVFILLRNPEKVKTQLKVYDTSGILVGNCGGKKQVFTRTLDFSKMPAGKYTVSIQQGKRNFTRTLFIS